MRVANGDEKLPPRAAGARETRADLVRHAAQLLTTSEAVVSAARDVRARSQQLVATVQHQRRLRSLDVNDHIQQTQTQ